MTTASVMTVGNGTVCEERCKDQVHLLLHVLNSKVLRCLRRPSLIAHDIEECLLLPCKGGIWQVLSGGGGPHCKGELLVATGDALPLRLALQVISTQFNSNPPPSTLLQSPFGKVCP